jgi:hypothetical protein
MRFRIPLILLFAMPCAAMYGCIWRGRGVIPFEDARMALAIILVFLLTYVLPRPGPPKVKDSIPENASPFDDR